MELYYEIEDQEVKQKDVFLFADSCIKSWLYADNRKVPMVV